jgi:flagellin
VQTFGVQFGTDTTRGVSVEVIASAQTASLFLSGNTTGAAGALLSSVTVEIAGNLGVQSVSFVSGTTLSAVVSAINTLRDSTGVSASLVNAADQTSGLVFSSVAYGEDQFVSVRKLGEGGDFFSTFSGQNGIGTQRDVGRDVAGIINGALADGRGLSLALNTLPLSIELTLTADFAQVTNDARSFTITGGGANFQLGPTVNATQQVGFGMTSIAATRLGGSEISGTRYYLDAIRSGGDFSLLDGNPQRTAQILDAAIDDISVLRGRLGAFERNTVQTNIRSLQVGLENITASESQIRDADFAEETAALTRSQILVQAGTSVLATANLSAQNVLALLG